MKRSIRTLGAVIVTTLVLPSLAIFAATDAFEANQDDALIKALALSKHTLVEGIGQVSKAPEVAISAKFEVEDGKLSLSVYTAEKGLGLEPEQNILKEFAGSPEAAAWKPEAETFQDVEHVSRASEQLTLMAISSASLGDILKRVEKDQPGTVFSITPMLRDRKAAFVVFVADKGKSVELVYDLLSGELVKPKKDSAPPKK